MAFNIGWQAGVLQSIKQSLNISLIFFQIIRINRNIFDIRVTEVVKVFPQHVINKALENCQAVNQAEKRTMYLNAPYLIRKIVKFIILRYKQMQ